MQRRSQGDGRGRRGTIRQPPLSEQKLRGMSILGRLFSDTRHERILELCSATSQQQLACPLTVSTRGIGFMITRMMKKLRQQLPENVESMPDPAIIYRASLAQLQEKMDLSRAVRLSFPSQPDLPYYDVWPSSFAIDRPAWILDSNRVNLSQIALIINSVGNFDFRKRSFGTVFAKDMSPLNIQITNLRDYCVKMSDIETEASKRIAAYELNSIPTAVWTRKDENDPSTILLANPDDIISPHYDNGALSRDLIKVHHWIDEIAKIVPELRSEIDYKGEGDSSLLVTTHVTGGQTLRQENGLISGDESIFWSRDYIDHDAWCIGIAGLTGEVLNPMDGGHRSNIGGARCCCSWTSITDMII